MNIDPDGASSTFAAAIGTYGEIEGMKAENAHREHCGLSVAYGQEAFEEVIERYGIKVPYRSPLAATT